MYRSGTRRSSTRLACFGAYDSVTSSTFNASQSSAVSPNAGSDTRGFRLVMVPEPSTGLLVIAAMLGIAVRRARRIEYH